MVGSPQELDPIVFKISSPLSVLPIPRKFTKSLYHSEPSLTNCICCHTQTHGDFFGGQVSTVDSQNACHVLSSKSPRIISAARIRTSPRPSLLPGADYSRIQSGTAFILTIVSVPPTAFKPLQHRSKCFARHRLPIVHSHPRKLWSGPNSNRETPALTPRKTS